MKRNKQKILTTHARNLSFILLLFLGSMIAKAQCTDASQFIPFPASGVITQNGVTMTITFTGSAGSISGSQPFGCFTGSFPSPFILLSGGNVIVNFNKPVNNAVFFVAGFGGASSFSAMETITFTTNTGTPTITGSNVCGNISILNNTVSGNLIPTTTNGGNFKVTAPAPYTQLIISGASAALNGVAIATCGTSIVAAAPTVQDLTICQGTTGNLNNANLEATPAQVEWHATNDANSPVMTNITAVGEGTYYAFFTVASGKPRTVGSAVTVSYYLPTELGNPCVVCYGPDTDGDGIPDMCDLDNDNDGILDNNECSTNLDRVIEWNHNNTSSPWSASGINSSYIASASDSTPGAGVTRSQYVTVSWLDGITSTSYPDAVAKNTYVEYAFTTAAFGTTSHYFYDRTVFWWTSAGTHSGNKYKVAVVISNDNFVTSTTLLTDITALQNGTYPYYNNTNKYRLNPGTTYKVRVYIYGLTNPGQTIDYDDYSISMRSFCDTDGDGIPDYLDLDSDNDGCLDAIEGSENVTSSMLVAAASGLSVGTGSTASNQNLCTGSTCVDAQGVPTVVNAGGAADTGSDQGQGIGSSANAAINPCLLCYKPGVIASAGNPALPSKVGITSLNRAGTSGDNWPATRIGGWLVLESKTKGFVPNRIAFSGANPVGIAPANFVEGMMVYDTTNKCLKMYTSQDGGTTFGWYCISTQTCPD